MPLDLYQDEAINRLSGMMPVQVPEAGLFDNFTKGAAMATLRGFARAGRAVDLLGSIPAILEDRIKGGSSSYNPFRIDWNDTTAQDKYFAEHDEVFNRAVDFWTPKPNEVGAAGEVVGGLLSMLPVVIASPSLAVGVAQLGAGEDLVRKGVSPGKALAVGAVEGAGLGLGIWMPILGQNLWQRVILGGAGFNAAQGIAVRGASGAILSGTEAEKDYRAFDGTQLTLDVLLGAAFGTLAHLSPAQRAQGAEMWGRVEKWAKQMNPEQLDAVVTLREAQHLNADSTPGMPVSATDIQAHADAMRKAIDDLLHGRPVDVENITAAARFLPDDQRIQFQAKTADDLMDQAAAMVRQGAAEGEAQAAAKAKPGFLRTAEDLLALRERETRLHPEIERAIEIANKPGFQRTAAERLFLESMLNGKAADYLLPEPLKTEGPSARPVEPTPPPGEAGKPGAPSAQSVDPLAVEAQRIVSERPDLPMTIGTDPDGKPITTTAAKFLDDVRAESARVDEDVRLVQAAAACMIGML